jgi:hypothetical protein
MTTSELFEKILERPSLYVGKPSVPLIAAFINGYEFESQTRGFKEIDENYRGFHTFVAKRFKIETSHGWAEIVTFMGQSETASFELAKQLWAEYKENNK